VLVDRLGNDGERAILVDLGFRSLADVLEMQLRLGDAISCNSVAPGPKASLFSIVLGSTWSVMAAYTRAGLAALGLTAA
jgi:hypothetical protein